MLKVGRAKLGWAAVLAGVAALIAWGLQPEPVLIDVAKLGRGDVVVTIEDEGIAQVREVYVVSSPITGTAQRSPVEIGDKVTRGKTVVASILPAVQSFLDERAVQISQAELKAAEAALDLAKANVERISAEAQFWAKQLSHMEQLRRTSTVSERTLDQTRMEAETRAAAEQSAKAEVDLRQREVERAEAALLNPPQDYVSATSPRCCLKIMAPEDGVVLRVRSESETVVGAGAPLLEIGNPRALEIVVELLSRDAVRVQVGANAVINAWGGDRLNARVRRIDNAAFTKISALGIEEQRVKVWLTLIDPSERWERLGHDYRVIAGIEVAKAENALRVPVSALFREQEDWAAFVRKEGIAKLARLQLSERNFEWAAVLGGVSEGDEVVLYPSDRLKDGVRVQDRR